MDDRLMRVIPQMLDSPTKILVGRGIGTGSAQILTNSSSVAGGGGARRLGNQTGGLIESLVTLA